jgi:N-acetylglucosaminyldiphosphoundecaprenol N-acetyl-beta-D-mannosaminyltransferase
MLLAAERDAGLREAVRAADLVVPDGAGLALAAALRGRRLPRVPGIELMESLCGRPGRRVFLFGAAPGVAEAAGRALTARHPGLEVSGATHGYSLTSPAEEDRVIGAIRSSRSDVLFAALSTPFQDAWIHRNLARFGVKLAMGVGGSFDVLSGRLRRAPAWMRSGGLEWLFRLRQEPRRIGRMAKLPLFLGKILLEK